MTSTTRTTSATYYVAVPASEPTSGIYGIGNDYMAAIEDAHAQTQTVNPGPTFNEETRLWEVFNDSRGETYTFADENRAREEAASLGFAALESTERLYRYVEAHGAAVGELRYVERHGKQDLDVDQGAVDEALDEVKEGLDGEHASTIAALKAEDALADAHVYVDAFIRQDPDSDYHDAVDDDPEFRLALDLAVRDHLLDLIAERQAA